MKTSKREDILFDYLEEATKPFTLTEFFKTTGLKKTKKNEAEIREMIEGTDYFVLDKKKFHPRDSFMPNISLRIKPTEMELQKGILIPGHRMLAFHPFNHFMDEITFRYEEKAIETKTIALNMDELRPYFLFMDMEKLPIHNIEAILEEGTGLEINACEMKHLYKRLNFQEGDTFVVKSTDFREGIFTLEFDSYENIQANLFQVEVMDRKFVRALKKILEKKLLFPNIEKQLLHTYFSLSEDSWEIPGSALGPLLSGNQEITFTSLPNGRNVFHFANQEFDDLDIYPDFADINIDEEEEIDLGTIDGILQFLDNNNDNVVVGALLLDLIAEKKRFNYNSLENYLFEGLEKPYMPDDLRELFKFLVEEEFKKLKKSFNPEYAFLPVTTTRKKILEELLLISKFLRTLDSRRVTLESLPKNEMMHLMEFDRALVEVLYNLETSQMEEINNSREVHRIFKMVDRMHSELPRIFEVIENKIK